jgi:RHH-type transcriptional regulator, proline utilization regulon repressor / proline dehydrogenase / delta 1-pyrroline-5-carboxylate dehydrogenase
LNEKPINATKEANSTYYLGTLMSLFPKLDENSPYLGEIGSTFHASENDVVDELLFDYAQHSIDEASIAKRAKGLVEYTRNNKVHTSGVDVFLNEYSLSSQEGAVLMCLAEALLRIPDKATAEKLIRDKIGSAEWQEHLGKSDSNFVNFSTWALMFSGRLVSMARDKSSNPLGIFKKMLGRSSEPVIRAALHKAMGMMGHQFVLAQTIDKALKASKAFKKQGYCYSYDMLGEGARTMEDAERYYDSYVTALKIIGKNAASKTPITAPGLSVKLSALHPRYFFRDRDRVLNELVPKVKELARLAKDMNVGLTIDAEEAQRLGISLEVLEQVAMDEQTMGWHGLGLAVQAYQKRASAVINWLEELAERSNRRFMVRLVKGAYWDSEIKWAQEGGFKDYPVFTRKSSTDLSYLVCAKKLLANKKAFYPQFATHNAQTVAFIMELKDSHEFEFQRLHGMGEALYAQIVDPNQHNIPCRIYAPVGIHKDLLPYLVRRLLENGANTSFVNRISNTETPIEKLVESPLTKTARLEDFPHPKLPLPQDIYGNRINSRGYDLSNVNELQDLYQDITIHSEEIWSASPLITGIENTTKAEQRTSPINHENVIGTIQHATHDDTITAINSAHKHYQEWDALGGDKRAKILEKAGDLIESERTRFITMLMKEGGKTIDDAISEIRETADFCRYYAMLARKHFNKPQELQGPTGESNHLRLGGRGVFGCISPWNFPLAIFIGQVTASLAAGNAVVAKPAGQTPLVAEYAIRLLHQAGIPKEILHFVPGPGSEIGKAITQHPNIAGIAFTGSTETAWHINRGLAAKNAPIIPLIAETGGQNCMIIDSSALAEQTVDDMIMSSFRSAGQRCSALRVAFVQEDVADNLLKMLTGAMEELRIGNPLYLRTDIGPVIDNAAKNTLIDHANAMNHTGKLLYKCRLNDETKHGSFFAPHAFEIDTLSQLKEEVFGPILHIVRYQKNHLDKVCDAINATDYGLTLGVQSRIGSTADYIRDHVHAGNIYVNRNMIGAVVGVQPFGGAGLSGTGPKAGSPHTLFRYASEQTYTVNTTAIGGNTSLIMLAEQ